MIKTLFPAALLFAAAPAAAEMTKLDVPADAIWQHVWTSAQMPPQLSGFTRTWIADYGSQETDVIGTYQDPESGTTASIFLYRAGLVNVALWQDRVLAAMSDNLELGPFDVAGRTATTFTPVQGGGPDSGYRFVGTITDGRFASSGSAMFAHSGWLVAVRMTSQTLDPAMLDQRLDAFISAIKLPQSTVSYPAATEIPDCAEKLTFKKDAKRTKVDMTVILIKGALMSAANKERIENPLTTVKAVNFCRDSSAGAAYGVYRMNGDRNAYLMALGDAGTATWVMKDGGSPLPGARGGGYWATLTNTEQSMLYAPFKSLPSPDQVYETIQSEQPITSVSMSPEGKSTINLPSL